MAKLAIKGHETRGTEVIALLEMLGGINVDNLDGDDMYYYYYITDDKEIDSVLFKYSDDKARIFSLEEFEEKFPYKIGDKVLYKTYGIYSAIKTMKWNSEKEQVFYRLDSKNLFVATVDELKPYKEETVKEKIQAYEVTEEFCANETAIEFDPSKFEMIERNGKYFVAKKQPQYPKTYKECCEVLMGKTDFQDFELVLTKLSINQAQSGINIFSPVPPHITLINNFYKLLICRDAYWKIAGEEMDLGKPWKPDYHEKSYEQGSPIKYVIYYTGTHITKEQKCTPSYILAFPTKEMRDAFFDNFKDLIEECKELL